MTASSQDECGDLSVCQACGACCSFSAEWPRFTLETDAELERIPPAFVAESQSGMRCHGNRCVALTGQVGLSTACGVYGVRPHVCRACMPGGDDCQMARERFGLRGIGPVADREESDTLPLS